MTIWSLRKLALGATAMTVALASSAAADPLPRSPRISGQVVQTRTGEEIEPVELPEFRNVEVRQDVKAGDVIRTNALGQVALLFADRTQIRLSRNTILVVKDVRADGGVTLDLQSGELFGRAARGGSGVTINTPAAASAIRGTDWTLKVMGNRTTLSVIEGIVDLTNPQGSVTVKEGEAAAATLGSAPSKIVTVGGNIREQMLYNIRLRSTFDQSINTAADGRRLSDGAARLATLPHDRWTPEDYVLSAEVAFARSGRDAAVRSLADARRRPLSASQDARLSLIEGKIAAHDGNYRQAVILFRRAERGLRGDGRIEAAYQAYFAQSLAAPTRALAPPAPSSSLASVLGQDTLAAVMESPSKALDVLRRHEDRFGGDVRYQVAIANRALLASDFDTMAKAIAKGAAIDPDDAALLDARASYRSYVKGDIKGALKDQRRAVQLEPGVMEYWNNLALLESARGAMRESEAAYKRATAVDPKAPEPLANYAGLLLKEGRNEEAKLVIDQAIAADPGFEISIFQRGRYKLQSGDSAGALEDMLKATAANPTYADGLLRLGATYAAQGDQDPASQSFELADKLDPLDPEPAQYQALLAVDQYQMDDAIKHAQDSVQRTRARDGDYSSVETSGDFGSTLGGVYRFAGLDAWGRYWGDRTFDPFAGGSYFDQALSGSVRPYFNAPGAVAVGEPNTGDDAAYSAYVQGLLLDPQAIASPRMHAAFFRVPFQETELGVGLTATSHDVGLNGVASYQRLGYDPIPYAFSTTTSYSYLDPSYADQDAKNLNSTIDFGMQVTPDDRFVGHLNFVHAGGGVSFDGVFVDGLDITRGDRLNANGVNAFLGWSHTFAYHNVLNFGLFGSLIDRSGTDQLATIFPTVPPIGRDIDIDQDQYSLKGGVAHTFEVADDVVLRWGAETGHVEARTSATLYDYFIGSPTRFPLSLAVPTVRGDTTRAWLGGAVDLTDQLRVDATLFGETSATNGFEEDTFAPRVGVAWAPADGQYLRAAYLRETPFNNLNTLAPIDIVGLRSDAVPDGTRLVDTAILRWDSEWNRRFFTAVEYQHQKIDDLPISLPVYNYSLLFPGATLDRLSLTGNYWIGDGVTAFASYSHIWSKVEDPLASGAIPTVPEDVARVGLSYVNPHRVRFTVAETYLGDRRSFDDPALGGAGETRQSASFLTDVAASWESEDRHLTASLAVFNLFDADADVAPLVPGSPRTITASLSGRF